MARSAGCLHPPVRTDQCLVARRSAELLDMVFDGRIRALGSRHKNRLHQPKVAFAFMPLGGFIKKHQRPRGCGSQERCERLNQGLLVFEVLQTEPADVGNEIVTVNDVLHAAIVYQTANQHYQTEVSEELTEYTGETSDFIRGNWEE